MAETYNIPLELKGDTFKVKEFEIIRNLVVLDISNYTIRCKFRKSAKTGKEIKSISLGSGIVLSTDGTDGKFKIEQFDLGTDFVSGTFYYDIEFTDVATGIIRTWIKGIFTVEQDTTY